MAKIRAMKAVTMPEKTEDTVAITTPITLPTPEVTTLKMSPILLCQSMPCRVLSSSSDMKGTVSSQAMTDSMAPGSWEISSSTHCTSSGRISHTTTVIMASRERTASSRHTGRRTLATLGLVLRGKNRFS